VSDELTAVSLFAGVGAFELALSRAGIRTAASVEIDPAARGVLAAHFPATTLFNDVTEVTGDDLRAAGFVPGRGIITAGWPCQGNSAAGRGAGLDDPRSGLWRHVVRLLAETRPRWFVGENVKNLLAVNDGLDYWTILSDLDELGYGVAGRVLDAQFFGLAQRRKRLFLVGCLGDSAGPAEVLLEPDSGGGGTPAGRPAPQGAARGRSGSAGADRRAGWGVTGRGTVSTLQGGGRRGHRIDAEGAAGGQLIVTRDTTGNITGIRRLTPLEWERLQGLPDEWTRWTADGAEQTDSARYRQIGNSLPVPVAAWVSRRIADLEGAATRTREVA
jgi:DNA (cytosine-5)-methyltransferase 1